MFHNNFWPNLEMDLGSGEWREFENRLPTPESLMRMSDPEFMVSSLRDDLALRLSAFKAGHIDDLDRGQVDRLAEHLGVAVDWESDDLRGEASTLLDAYSLAATRHILGKLRDFAREREKKLLVILFDPYRVMLPALRGESGRYDQPVVDFLRDQEFEFIDANALHVEDFKAFAPDVEAYKKRYFIGHYNPAGNHFFAYAIKDRVVGWLEPKPVTYRNPDEDGIHFRGYLEDFR